MLFGWSAGHGDRRSGRLADTGEPGDFWDVALSPDERHLAVVDHRSVDGHFWISIIDLARNLQVRFSDPQEFSFAPVWSRDSSRVYFFSARSEKPLLFAKAVDEAGPEKVLTAVPEAMRAHDLSPDGKTLLADDWREGGSHRVIVSMTLGESEWHPLMETKFNAELGQFSPDGKRVAYQSDESGRNEIYVTDFPQASHKQRISVEGGTEPRWRHDGQALYYLAPEGTMMSAPSDGRPRPTAVFKVQMRNQSGAFRYAPARDGRFLIINGTPDPRSKDLTVVSTGRSCCTASRSTPLHGPAGSRVDGKLGYSRSSCRETHYSWIGGRELLRGLGTMWR